MPDVPERPGLWREIASAGAACAFFTAAEAHYLLAVKSNQPTLRTEIEDYFGSAPAEVLDTAIDWDMGHGRIEERTVTVSREADWLGGDRRFPGELRLAGVTTITKVRSRTELKDSDKKTIKLGRKVAGWDVPYLTSILGLPPR